MWLGLEAPILGRYINRYGTRLGCMLYYDMTYNEGIQIYFGSFAH